MKQADRSSGKWLITVFILAAAVLAAVFLMRERNPEPKTAVTTVESGTKVPASAPKSAGDIPGAEANSVQAGSSADLRTSQISPENPAASKVSDTAERAGFTLLIYMIGSDLESLDGAATDDITEIVSACSGEGLKILFQTGGAQRWYRPEITSAGTQRLEAADGTLTSIEDLGVLPMASPDTLRDFIRWGTERCPADRYGLILWDHGGASLLGYGKDEYYPSDSLTLAGLRQALDEAGTRFSFIGFDACMMGTLETALALAPCADYMIASEEMEPSTGWYYPEWITELSKDPDMAIPDLGPRIVDSFLNGPDYNKWDYYTLAVLDLSFAGLLRDALKDYLAESAEYLDTGFSRFSLARTSAKSYGDDSFESVDLIDFLDASAESGIDSSAVREAAEHMVISAGSNIAGTHGIAFYFPSRYPVKYTSMVAMLESLGYKEDYFQFFSSFLNTTIVGRALAFRSTDPSAALEYGYEKWQLEPWFDIGSVDSDSITVPTPEALTLLEKTDWNGETYYALHLKDEMWNQISEIWTDYYLVRYNGLADFGTDQTHSWDEDGDLVFDFDYTGLTLNGLLVPFYQMGTIYGQDVTESYSYGYVPAVLNDRFITIEVIRDYENPNGRVVGYRYCSENIKEMQNGEDPFLPDKGLHAFQDGDEIYIYYARYSMDTSFDRLVQYDEPIVYDGEFITAWSSFRGEPEKQRTAAGLPTHAFLNFRLVDIYGNTHYTNTVDFQY